MKRRALLSTAVATALLAFSVPGPAVAAGLPTAAAATDLMSEQEEAERVFVRWVSANDPRPAVRSAARSALLSSSGATAITTFLLTGYDTAITRAEQTRTRQYDYTERMVATHAAQYYPRVNAAGRRALVGTDAELAEFATTGYTAALALDRQGIADDRHRADLIAGEDHAFVTGLSEDDPGPQVRAWAGRAVAPGTTAADVAEFLSYGWVSAAGLDLQTHRRQAADADRQWLSQTRRLVVEAQAAEQAAREAAAEAQAQARAAAARAWNVVGTQTGSPRVAWADAEQVALRQAESWLQIAAVAAAATSPNWLNIAGTAAGTRDEWLAEQQNAAAQAATWAALYQQALAAEAALTDPVG
ncbi:hypothetical protein [Actinoplanes rectilineatus]|uniref:hypothetical protein n=1 Tax=Actinoplanes rectilineatus TaxID=113571 RepID=UPI00069872A7|nr:hypothetical protein [Actinoplanes rectilineatus]